MKHGNPLNVYTGPDSLTKYYDPENQPLLPLVEIPAKLNPFLADGVHIYGKMMSALPANNVKSLPALNMLQSKEIDAKTKTIVEYSSGSTVISLAIIARVLHNITDVRAYLSNKTSDAKLKMMRFFGLDITVFGGPSQPEPDDPRGGIQKAQRNAEGNEEIFNPNQYENDALNQNQNPGAHTRWTGPQLLRQLPELNVFCAGMGTSGTMTGIGTYLRQAKPSITRVGVCTIPGDRVPGPRAHALLSPVKFPWREAVDTIEEVGSTDSYRLSMELSREGLICGPSSGFNLQGLYNFLQRHKDRRTLSDIAGPDGSIHCVFICCDLPYQYLDEYFTKLGEEHFHPIGCQNLLGVDLYRYDESWELDAKSAINRLYSTFDDSLMDPTGQLHSNAILLDFRSSSDFTSGHLPGAINLPLNSLKPSTPSPFSDAKVLEAQWRELNALFSSQQNPSAALLATALKDRIVGTICYDGDTARVASSVLRAQDIDGYSIRGGMRGLSPSPAAAANIRCNGESIGVETAATELPRIVT
ncbi:MAG: hypothetical protein M1837_007222 [Sclerophora amabilis]|nr:MAG: hypothetical protein M1837_007222 [Sclerophora amabilis]